MDILLRYSSGEQEKYGHNDWRQEDGTGWPSSKDKEVAVKWYDNRGVSLIGTSLEGCDGVRQCCAGAKDRERKWAYLVPKWSKITTATWEELISWIKEQLHTSSTGRHLAVVITSGYSLIWWTSLEQRGMELVDYKIVVK